MRVNISRTFLEASVSVTAPSGRVPFTGAASSGIGASQETAAGCNEMRSQMKNALDDVRGNGVVGARFTDTRREDETHHPAARFLIGAHGFDQSCSGDAGPGRQGSETPDEGDDTGYVIGTRQSKLMAEERRSNHAPSHSFPVPIAAVLRDAFESVGEGMAEIQNFAEAGFAFIAADDTRFDLDVLRDEPAECRAITTQDTFQVLLKHREHGCVRNNGVLDDFGEAAAEFAVWEGAQQFWVGEHQARRVECTDEIFPFGEIHPSFAADRTVHLRDDSRRHVYQSDATQKGCRDESGNVADDSASYGNNHRLAVHAGLHQRPGK